MLATTLALTVALLSPQQTAPPPVYDLDAAHTNASFAVRHLALTRVRGSIPVVSGTILYDPDDPSRSSTTVVLDAARLDTRNEERDADLRENFFRTDSFPHIVFRSSDFDPTDQGFLLHGDLTIRGVTRPVTMPVQLLGSLEEDSGAKRIAFTAELRINRRDFGVSSEGHPAEIRLVIGEEVTITLDVEAVMRSYTAVGYRDEEAPSVGPLIERLATTDPERVAAALPALIASDSLNSSPREVMLAGLKLMETGHHGGAAEVLSFQAPRQPSAPLWSAAAEAALRSGDTAAARSALERALELDPLHSRSLELMRWARE